MANHFISKQTLQLRYFDSVAAGALQRTLSDWLKHSLQPAMEALFSELDHPTHRLRFDKLEIDAGEIKGSDWQQQLTEKVCGELKQQIRTAAVFPVPIIQKNEPLTPGTLAKTTIYSKEEQYQLLWYYLKTGQLPWYAAGVDTTALLGWLNRAAEEGFFIEEESLRLLKNNTAALNRLLLQAKQASIESWFMAWNKALMIEWLAAVLRIAKQVFGAGQVSLRWSYAVLFHRLAGTHAQPLWKRILYDYWIANPALEQMMWETNSLIDEQLLLNSWQQKVTGLVPQLERQEKQPGTDDRKTGTSYFIQNAGLVLLHPFLPAFFSNLGLRKEDKWTNDDAQRKAVLLLNCLSSSSILMMEYELPLCKLLCGWPMDHPVEALLDLTEHESTECTLLLQHVIDQWAILKSTSVETLQASFLQRSGKLSIAENGWLLQVEQQSIDILIQHLPWTIGVAKNSLMQEILYTEWA